MKEGFATAGAIDNIGVINTSYDLVASPDQVAPEEDFADLVQCGDHMNVLSQLSEYGGIDPSCDDCERIQGSCGDTLMPRVSKNVTPYNVDVANPSMYSYMASAPMAVSQVKSRFKDYSASSFIRGDIPIRYCPDVPLISKTFQGRDDWRGDGLFSPGFNALYNKLTGNAYKNLPLHVAGAGQACGYGGASGGVIMS